MKRFKSVISILLIVSVCFGMFTFSSFAASAESKATYSTTPFEGTFENPNGTRSTYYVYKTINGKRYVVKKSKYPMVVSDDGYYVYYSKKTSNSATIIMKSPAGKTISKTTITGGEGYTDSLYIGFGIYQDRLWTSFVGDYAYYETQKCLYVLGKNGSVKRSDNFSPNSKLYWAAYREGVGKMSYAMGTNYEEGISYFYIPEKGKTYRDKFEDSIRSGSVSLYKLSFGNRNYGTKVIINYIKAGAETDIMGNPMNESDYYYGVGDISTGKVLKVFTSLSAAKRYISK